MDMEVQTSTINLKQRIDLVKLFLMSSNIELLKHEKSDIDRFERFVIELDHKIYDFHFILKNVVNSGWKDKPYIKRIQIPPLGDSGMHINQHGVYSCLLGNVYVNGKPYFVVWNPFRFTFHKSNRSCYVWDQSLISAATEKHGFYRTVDSDKELIICDQNNFDKLIKEYINRNGLDD